VGACGAAAAAGGGGVYILGHRRPRGLTATAHHTTSLTARLLPLGHRGPKLFLTFWARSGGGAKSAGGRKVEPSMPLLSSLVGAPFSGGTEL